MSARNYYVAVNSYRSSTDNGFANTWRIYRCHTAKQQGRILRDGLPVGDTCYLDNDGRRTPVCSTMGVRAATASERRHAERDFAPYLDNYMDESPELSADEQSANLAESAAHADTEAAEIAADNARYA